MDVNIIEIKDGDSSRPQEAPSVHPPSKPKFDGSASGKKKRRRGKYKRKIMIKAPWQDRRINDKRNNRFRKIVLAKTHAPFNNNQFLMEIHKPEPENNFNISQTPSARTRDSSFSVDSEDNYFYSLPEDEEEYLTKEFSSVYEDAQCERLSNMSKAELIQEYLLLEAKYDTLIKRTDRSRPKYNEDDKETTVDRDTTATEKDSMLTDRDMSASSEETSATDEPSIDDILQRIKEQEEQILALQAANDTLKLENEHLRQRTHDSSSADSESDSSSTSASSSSCSNRSTSPANFLDSMVNGRTPSEHNGHNGVADGVEPVNHAPGNGIDHASDINE